MIDFRRPTVLFGGSFDPVHEGHLHVARETLARIEGGSQLVFLPAFHSPGKPGPLASPEQRLEWLLLAAAPDGFGVWDYELQRRGESVTVDTLGEAHRLGATAEQLFLLLGADAYGTFPAWKNALRIRELCRLIAVNRPGHQLPAQSLSDRILNIPPHPASSTAIRARLGSGSIPTEWLAGPVSHALEKLLPLHNPYARNFT
jgi:nicotinate-nucleotide adenylyltransferase